MNTISLSEMKDRVGRLCGQSEWLVIDQDRVNAFAEITGDFERIHIDEEFGRRSIFGGTIAHGFLSLSLYPKLMASSDFPALHPVKLSLNYGGDKVRFISPVRVGKRIRGHFRLVGFIEKRADEWQQTIEYIVEIEGEEKPALVANWIGMHFV